MEIEKLSAKKKLKLLRKIFYNLMINKWKDHYGDFIHEHIVFNWLEKNEFQRLVRNIVARNSKEIKQQSYSCNTKSLDSMGYYEIHDRSFQKWLLKNHANCYLTNFCSEEIKSKIEEYRESHPLGFVDREDV